MDARAARTVAPVLLALFLAAASAACVPNMAAPARTADGYRAAVQKTAGAAGSAVSTARLDAEAGADDRAFFPYLSTSISDAEDQLASVSSTFGSIEPPADDESARLRRQTTDVLERSAADVSAARIAVRRGDAGPLADIARALQADADELDRLAS